MFSPYLQTPVNKSLILNRLRYNCRLKFNFVSKNKLLLCCGWLEWFYEGIVKIVAGDKIFSTIFLGFT